MVSMRASLLIGALPLMVISCVRWTPATRARPAYRVHHLARSLSLDAHWDKAPWNDVEPLETGNYMGARPEHRPRTQVKLLYDDENLYVIFRVEDRYVRAVARQAQGEVWKDSCVEFFFTPGADVAAGYFNLEVNCGGASLLHFQKVARQSPISVAAEDMKRIEIAHSMPAVIEPEIAEPTTWTLEYRLPFDVLEKYASVARPKPGVVWRANFYKCADGTSHPHWLTWSKVENPTPDFHLPQFFGVLQFM
jgi:hypothetical protein